jgi:5-methylcytosine-specific restriction endonuclease McrA
MNQAVVVLNADMSIINIVTWKRAYALVNKGRAEIVEASDKTVSNSSGTYLFVVPAIIRLVTFVKNVYNAKVSFSKAAVFVRDKHTCVYCSSKADLTLDHVMPTSKGGDTSFLNCVTSCWPCNKKKGNKTLEQAGMHLRRKPHHPSLVEYFQNRIEQFGLQAVVEKSGILRKYN